MAEPAFQSLPGFRDFIPRECAIRNYLFETWRAVARRCGYSEYETPILEDTALYLKKSGGELSAQLFCFEDQGGRDVALRPEVTASLARLVAQHQRDFPKPIKWFEIGQCFRYEKPQKGRGREFYQFNVDILGEAGPAADAELIALAIETMLAFGFVAGDFVIRVSDRKAWLDFAARHGLAEESIPDFLNIIDKLERTPPELLKTRLAAYGLSPEAVRDFIANPNHASTAYQAIRADLTARGLADCVQLDLSIVRGLAYYTGVVFEVFDAKKSMRAVAGGGRYDTLVATLSDGATELPATGFAMGDHVIRNLIEETTHAAMQMEVWLQRNAAACDVFVVVADESQRPVALRLVTELRRAGIAADLPLTPAKVARQFQSAARSRARFALLVGTEYPALKLKILASRAEEAGHAATLIPWLTERLQQPDGPLLA
ncbi:MAG: histidine--tRNA ligase [Verrucomicrobia bacterium]|nr:histidine--tRNA ligase [Verrucomicrobiota bacterium]